MTFADQIRYNIMFHQVVHEGGDSAINYIKMFQNVKDLGILVGNSYTGDQLMHTFLDNLQQCGKNYARMASYQVYLRR